MKTNTRTPKSLRRIVRNSVRPMDKAYALQASMYKGPWANGTSIVTELYETGNHLPDNHGRKV